MTVRLKRIMEPLTYANITGEAGSEISTMTDPLYDTVERAAHNALEECAIRYTREDN